jgi:uncharacterized protein HemX
MNAPAILAALAAGVGGIIIGLRWGRWERHDLHVHAVRQHQEILRLLNAQEHAACNSTIRLLSNVVQAQQGHIDHLERVIGGQEDLNEELQRLIEDDA